MPAPVFRSLTDNGNATAANITGTEPAGAVADDILIASLYVEATVTVTPPAGWSDTFGGTTMVGTATVEVFKQYLYWIRRGGSAPALQWVFSSAYRQLVIAAYDGALASGDPFSFGDVEVRDNNITQTWPDTSGVTTDADECLVFAGTNFRAGTSSDPPTGFTERQDISLEDTIWADKSQASAGATGTITGAQVSAGGTTGPHISMLVGLRPEGVGGGGELDVHIGEPITGSSALN